MLKTFFNKLIFLILFDDRGECKLPDDVLRSLAESFIPYILAFFESEEGQKEYAEWEARQNKDSQKEQR